jgi:hypothetical protein
MKRKTLKQVAGIDVAEKELVVTPGRIFGDLCLELFAYKTFSNNEKGFPVLHPVCEKALYRNHPFALRYGSNRRLP